MSHVTATTTGRRGADAWIICVLAAVSYACSGPAAPSPGPTPTPTSPSGTRLQMSGRVLNESGVPVARALVEVDYSSLVGTSTPPSTCPGFTPVPFCWLATTTNDLGEYSVVFAPLPWPRFGLGYVYSFADGYETDVQWVPVGQSPAIRDMKLRATRPIVAGSSTRITVDATSSLCTDLEDNWAMENRCEIVVVESGPGTLIVEARAVSGPTVPFMLWYTTGNYGGFITRPGPGLVSIPVRGGTYRIMVGLPDGSPAQQIDVTTSLR